MTPDRIFEALETAGPGRFPRAALNEAVEQREAITPLLLEELRRQVDAAFAPAIESESWWRHLFAMYLLAYFREPAAYPLFVKMGFLPEDTLYQAIGDSITESFGRQLAAVCHGDTSGIERLIEDPGVSVYVRSGALGALELLYAVGELERDALEERLGRFASRWLAEAEAGQALTEGSDWVWATLAWIAADADLQGLVPIVRRAFELDLVDPMLGGDLARFEQTLAEHRENPKPYEPPRGHHLPAHPVEELENWACFRPLEPRAPRAPDRKAGSVVQRRVGAKIGRNEPCPCGSGKKYKKCCGA